MKIRQHTYHSAVLAKTRRFVTGSCNEWIPIEKILNGQFLERLVQSCHEFVTRMAFCYAGGEFVTRLRNKLEAA